jgi:hypothetical protein
LFSCTYQCNGKEECITIKARDWNDAYDMVRGMRETLEVDVAIQVYPAPKDI